MLTAAELTAARADVLETLVNSIAIQRSVTTYDDAGYPSEVFGTQTTVPGRIDNLPRSTAADVIAMQESGRVFYQLTVTWDADLRDGDVVLIDSIQYDVKSVALSQDLRIVRRAIIVKVS